MDYIDRWLNYIYRCPVCGGAGFNLYERPEVGDIALSCNVVKNDGTQPKPGEAAICGSCGAQVRFEVKYIEKTWPFKINA